MKWVITGAIVVIIGAIIGSGRTPYYLLRSTIGIHDHQIVVEQAVTDAQRRTGLMGRSSLALNRGMLLVFPRDDYWGIWMKNMKIPLDVFWIAADGAVVDIHTAMQPERDQFTGSVPSRYVLELPAGSADRFGIQRGDIALLMYN